MTAMKITKRGKYDCNYSYDEDQISLQSCSQKGTNMTAIMITVGP